MAAKIIRCRKGDPCRFEASVMSGIDARYDRAKFQVRAEWDETLPALLSVDETSGITITAGTPGTIGVVIGATLTDALPVLNQPRMVAAQLRLYNSSDDDDRISFPISFELQPEVIVDA